MIKKIITLICFLTATAWAGSVSTPKYDIYSLENTKNNVFRVRENFRDLSANKIDASLAVDNYSNQTIAGDKTFTGDTSLSGSNTISSTTVTGSLTANGPVTINSNPTLSSATVTNTLTANEVTTTYGFFHDRGDADFDMTTGAFVKDGTYQVLSLASIVPPGAKTIKLFVIATGNAGGYMKFGKRGNTYASAWLILPVTGVDCPMEIDIPCNENREIQYLATNTTWTYMALLVKGWYK
jgi:hypothetical protein